MTDDKDTKKKYWHGFYGPDAFPEKPKEKSPIVLEVERRIAIVEKYGGIKRLISDLEEARQQTVTTIKDTKH